jgi:predicted metal-binding membrane protein
MTAAWMVALTALLVLEREFPRAERAGMAVGVILLALAGWQFAV